MRPRVRLAALAAAALLVWAARGEAAAEAYDLRVDGLACPFCAYGIEKQLRRIDGVESVSTEIASGTVTVTMEEGATLEEGVARRAVEDAGFTLRSFEQTSAGQKAGE